MSSRNDDGRVAKARESNILEIAGELGARLKRVTATEHVGPCPICGGTDRFSVNTKDRVFNCRGAGGGDVIAMVEHVRACSFVEALDYIVGERGQAAPARRAPAAAGPRDDAPLPGEVDGPSDGPEGDPERDAIRKAPARVYDYRDEDGRVRYQKLRFEWRDADGTKHKTFRQRRPARPGDDPKKVRDGWIWRLPGSGERLPYRLADVQEGVSTGEMILITEGEKDADTCAGLGLYATCTDMGAGVWPEEISRYFAGADVVILEDNDPQSVDKEGKPRVHSDGRPVIPGRDHTRAIGRALRGIAKRVRVLRFPELPPKGDVSDFVEATGAGAVELCQRIKAEAVEWAPERPVTRFGAIPFEDIDKPGPETQWLVRNFITLDGRSVMGGESGSGKTFLALHMAMCVATYREFFGNRVAGGLVIYQAGESPRGLKKRIRAWRDHHDIDPVSRVPIVMMGKKIDLSRPDADVGAFIEEVLAWRDLYPEHPLRLVAIDTLAKTMIGIDENSSKEVGVVLENIAKIEEACGCHVMSVHHLNKEGKKLRGSTAIQANIDQVISVEKDELGIRTATVVKQKEAEGDKKISFELFQVELGRDEFDEPITSAVCVPLGGSESARAQEKTKGFRLSANEAHALRALFTAVDEEGIEAPDELGLSAGVRVTTAKAWLKYYMRIVDHKSDDPKQQEGTARTAISRSSKSLLHWGVIGRNNPYCWHSGKKIVGFPRTYGKERSESAEKPREPSKIEGEIDSLGELLF